jgi:hypothetical protein
MARDRKGGRREGALEEAPVGREAAVVREEREKSTRRAYLQFSELHAWRRATKFGGFFRSERFRVYEEYFFFGAAWSHLILN